MTELTDLAARFQDRLVAHSDAAARRVARLWRQVSPASLEAGWDAVAPSVGQVMDSAQVTAAAMGASYAARSLAMQGVSDPVDVVPGVFAGVTREGRAVVPELFAGVTTAKTLIGRGAGVPAAFQAGSAVMQLLAANIIRDTGRSAGRVAAVGSGSRFSVRVVSAGACSRCAILAGVKGYRVDFERHPGCRCTSMWLTDDQAPEGFFREPTEYFESLTEAEQDRIFTKAGAESIRLGADPAKVVNARRGSFKSASGRLRKVQISTGSNGPIMGYATLEGATARSAWARNQGLSRGVARGDRYRRTTIVRLMPEQIIRQAATPERARELLQMYGYIR